MCCRLSQFRPNSALFFRSLAENIVIFQYEAEQVAGKTSSALQQVIAKLVIPVTYFHIIALLPGFAL
jgi:hypothetical protein